MTNDNSSITIGHTGYFFFLVFGTTPPSLNFLNTGGFGGGFFLTVVFFFAISVTLMVWVLVLGALDLLLLSALVVEVEVDY